MRTKARPSPTYWLRPTDTTRRPSANCPGVKVNSRTETVPTTTQAITAGVPCQTYWYSYSLSPPNTTLRVPRP